MRNTVSLQNAIFSMIESLINQGYKKWYHVEKGKQHGNNITGRIYALGKNDRYYMTTIYPLNIIGSCSDDEDWEAFDQRVLLGAYNGEVKNLVSTAMKRVELHGLDNEVQHDIDTYRKKLMIETVRANFE